MASLTRHDIAKLRTDGSPQVRAQTAAKIGAEFSRGGLDPAARAVAEDIFRLMVRDAEVRVRRELSDSLKNRPLVPHDVALALARDVIEVAAPMLTCSQVLTDDDLIEIVRTQPSTSREAVARRETVSAAVADALVDSRDEAAVAVLVSNPAAQVSDAAFDRILDGFPDSAAVKHSAVHRLNLPIKVAERLVSMVSDRLREHLVTHHELPGDLASDLILESREKATLGLVSDGARESDIDELVGQLYATGRLNPSIVLRGLCTGDLVFFVSAMARLAGVPVAHAQRSIHDADQRNLDDLCGKAGLPQEMHAAIRVAVNVAREMDFDGEPGDRERYRSRTIERFLTQFEDLDADNLDYLLGKLGRSFNTRTGRDDARASGAPAP